MAANYQRNKKSLLIFQTRSVCYEKYASHTHHLSNITRFFGKFEFAQMYRKCWKRYKQTCKLLEMRIEVIVNGTFWAKYNFFVIFRKMPRSGVTERRVGHIDLNPASIYSYCNINTYVTGEGSYGPNICYSRILLLSLALF